MVRREPLWRRLRNGTDLDKLQQLKNVRFSGEGYQVLGKAVAEGVRKALEPAGK